MDTHGKLLMECLLETKASKDCGKTLSLAFEEGTSAAWLHDLLNPHVSRLVVCKKKIEYRVVAPVLESSVRGRVSVNEIGRVCFGTESHIARYAPSDNQKWP